MITGALQGHILERKLAASMRNTSTLRDPRVTNEQQHRFFEATYSAQEAVATMHSLLESLEIQSIIHGNDGRENVFKIQSVIDEV